MSQPLKHVLAALLATCLTAEPVSAVAIYYPPDVSAQVSLLPAPHEAFSQAAFANTATQVLHPIRESAIRSWINRYILWNVFSTPRMTRLFSDILSAAIPAKGGIVSVDGNSGTGKSWLTTLRGGVLPSGRRAVTLNMDGFIRHSAFRKVIAKTVMGEQLSDAELAAARRYTNDLDAELRRAVPGQPYPYEEEYWRNDEIESMLKQVRSFLDAPFDPKRPGISIPYVAFNQNKGILEPKTLDVHYGDIVIAESKYANRAQFDSYYDLRCRVGDDPKVTEARFAARQEKRHPGPHFSKSPRFYELLMRPTWDAYERESAARIDVTIDKTSQTLAYRTPPDTLRQIRESFDAIEDELKKGGSAVNLFLIDLLRLRILHLKGVLIDESRVHIPASGANLFSGLYGSLVRTVDNRIRAGNPMLRLFEDFYDKAGDAIAGHPLAGNLLPPFNSLRAVEHSQANFLDMDFMHRWVSSIQSGDVVLLQFVVENLIHWVQAPIILEAASERPTDDISSELTQAKERVLSTLGSFVAGLPERCMVVVQEESWVVHHLKLINGFQDMSQNPSLFSLREKARWDWMNERLAPAVQTVQSSLGRPGQTMIDLGGRLDILWTSPHEPAAPVWRDARLEALGVDRHREILHDCWVEDVPRPMKGVERFIRAAHESRIRLSIASGAEGSMIDAYLAIENLLHAPDGAPYFDGGIEADNPAKRFTIQKAATETRQETGVVVMFGDAPADREAASKVPGTIFVGVGSKSRVPDAHFYISDFSRAFIVPGTRMLRINNEKPFLVRAIVADFDQTLVNSGKQLADSFARQAMEILGRTPESPDADQVKNLGVKALEETDGKPDLVNIQRLYELLMAYDAVAMKAYAARLTSVAQPMPTGLGAAVSRFFRTVVWRPSWRIVQASSPHALGRAS